MGQVADSGGKPVLSLTEDIERMRAGQPVYSQALSLLPDVDVAVTYGPDADIAPCRDCRGDPGRAQYPARGLDDVCPTGAGG